MSEQTKIQTSVLQPIQTFIIMLNSDLRDKYLRKNAAFFANSRLAQPKLGSMQRQNGLGKALAQLA